jgi:hypothetical protein
VTRSGSPWKRSRPCRPRKSPPLLRRPRGHLAVTSASVGHSLGAAVDERPGQRLPWPPVRGSGSEGAADWTCRISSGRRARPRSPRTTVLPRSLARSLQAARLSGSRFPRRARRAKSATRCASEYECGSGAGRDVPGQTWLLHAYTSHPNAAAPSAQTRQHRCGRECPPRQRATMSRDCSVFVRCTTVRRCAPAAALPARAIVSAGVLPPTVIVGVTLTVQ